MARGCAEGGELQLGVGGLASFITIEMDWLSHSEEGCDFTGALLLMLQQRRHMAGGSSCLCALYTESGVGWAGPP